MPAPVCLADYERLALSQLDEATASYLFAGAGDQITLRRNSEAFEGFNLSPRVLRPLAGGHTKLELLGKALAHPIIVAPMAFQQLAHGEGERATALGAAAQDAMMTLSCQSSVGLEDVYSVGPSCRWFQIYFQPERMDTLRLVERAQTCGYEAIVVTCDAPVTGVRNAEQRMGFQLPPNVRPVNLQDCRAPGFAPLSDGESAVFDRLANFAPTWEDIAWLKNQTGLPLILKGILRASDAEQAIRAGAAAIIVSNHGGRTCDTAISTIQALPKIAQAVNGRIPILMDGGIRRGTDILKALALGASAVMVGRPILHGLVVDGARGVSHVLRILRDEFEVAMALTGCRTVAEVTEDLIA